MTSNMEDENTMIEIISREYCTGCEACMNICNKQAITMERNSEGFDFPKIDKSLCIDCKLCEKTCPVINHEKLLKKKRATNDFQYAFAAKSNREEDRKISSSGAIFPVIARHILKNGGVVVAAAFDEKYNVMHVCISDESQLEKLQGSKYVQSKIGDAFRIAKEYLEEGKSVLFVGLACQVEGLRAFLKKGYENLICIDLICMGIPSPGVWRKYLDCYFGNQEIKNINFKEKSLGWHRFSFVVQTEKDKYSEVGKDNVFMQSMFKTYAIRESCFNCKFKTLERISDLTIADCWGVEKFASEMDDNRGLSSVIIHTIKGLELWDEINGMINYKEIEIQNICNGNPNLIRVVKKNKGRKFFYQLLNSTTPKLAFELMCRNPDKFWLRRLKRGIVRIISYKRR